jgi:hypothetical protein
MKHNIQTNVDENITKARRSAYSLFGCGFHEHNGLDAESLLHIYKTYITSILLYGMGLLLPSSKPLELERNKKTYPPPFQVKWSVPY